MVLVWENHWKCASGASREIECRRVIIRWTESKQRGATARDPSTHSDQTYRHRIIDSRSFFFARSKRERERESLEELFLETRKDRVRLADKGIRQRSRPLENKVRLLAREKREKGKRYLSLLASQDVLRASRRWDMVSRNGLVFRF